MFEIFNEVMPIISTIVKEYI